MTTDGNCPQCGSNLALVGRMHRCVSPVVIIEPRELDRQPADPAAPPTGAKRQSKAESAEGTPALVSRDRKPGRPRLLDAASTIEKTKPWKKCKPRISRRTWYRRRKDGTL